MYVTLYDHGMKRKTLKVDDLLRSTWNYQALLAKKKRIKFVYMSSDTQFEIDALDKLGSLDASGKPVVTRLKDVKSALAIL